MFCARCAVTPYCSEQCQRKDWIRRHSAVCHNLMRLNANRSVRSASPVDPVGANNNVTIPAPPAPLRRPRSPNASRGAPQRNGLPNGNKSFEKARSHTNHHKNNNKAKFVPPGHHPPPQRLPRAAPHSDQPLNQNDDDDWESADKKTPQLKPALKITDIKNELPRPKHDMNNRFDRPKPKFETSSPNVETSSPKIETSSPKFETSSPKIETPQPKFETSSPKIDTPQPKIEMPSPKRNVRMGANFGTETRVEMKPQAPQLQLVPAQFLVEKLPIGESFLVSVEQAAAASGSGQRGYVCIGIHADYEAAYGDLMGDICDGDNAIVPKPGATFAFLEPADDGWYRARCLGNDKCALLDAGRVADVTAHSQCRALAPKYADIPEFCCVLDGKVDVGMSLRCTILMKNGDEYKVSLDTASEDSTYLGEGVVSRWLPEVDLPTPVKPASIQARLNLNRVEPQSSSVKQVAEAIPEVKHQAIPETKVPEAKAQAAPEAKVQTIPSAKGQASQKAAVPDIVRPDVVNNGRYVLLHVTSLARACVRACDVDSTAEFESVIQDTVLYGLRSAKPLATPPSPGDVVLCSFEGHHYRALVVRTKASENRYKVQYAEYGNDEIVPIEKMYTCPPELSLSCRPARASLVALSAARHSLAPEASDYIDSLKEEAELIATIPTGEKCAPSGSLVLFSLAKNKENVSKKIEAMCTPEWVKLEQAGGDVVESEVILFSSMNTLPLPTDRQFVLEVTDFSFLESGNVCGFERGQKSPALVYGPLTEKINEYCKSSLCSEPYVPVVEEVCLARLEPYPQWFRAVVAEHRPGEPTASVVYIDYGTLAPVPVSDLRKCMPEFAREPALAASADIKDWPSTLTTEQLSRALEFLQVDEEGRGRLPVARCRRADDNASYVVDAPLLLAAINK